MRLLYPPKFCIFLSALWYFSYNQIIHLVLSLVIFFRSLIRYLAMSNSGLYEEGIFGSNLSTVDTNALLSQLGFSSNNMLDPSVLTSNDGHSQQTQPQQYHTYSFRPTANSHIPTYPNMLPVNNGNPANTNTSSSVDPRRNTGRDYCPPPLNLLSPSNINTSPSLSSATQAIAAFNNPLLSWNTSFGNNNTALPSTWTVPNLPNLSQSPLPNETFSHMAPYSPANGNSLLVQSQFGYSALSSMPMGFGQTLAPSFDGFSSNLAAMPKVSSVPNQPVKLKTPISPLAHQSFSGYMTGPAVSIPSNDVGLTTTSMYPSTMGNLAASASFLETMVATPAAGLVPSSKGGAILVPHSMNDHADNIPAATDSSNVFSSFISPPGLTPNTPLDNQFMNSPAHLLQPTLIPDSMPSPGLTSPLLSHFQSSESINDIDIVTGESTTEQQIVSPYLQKSFSQPESGGCGIHGNIFEKSQSMDGNLNINGLITSEGLVLSLSGSLVDIVGYLPAEFINRKMSEFIHPDDINTFISDLKAASSHTILRGVYRFRKKNSDYVKLSILGYSFINNNHATNIATAETNQQSSAVAGNQAIRSIYNTAISPSSQRTEHHQVPSQFPGPNSKDTGMTSTILIKIFAPPLASNKAAISSVVSSPEQPLYHDLQKFELANQDKGNNRILPMPKTKSQGKRGSFSLPKTDLLPKSKKNQPVKILKF